MRRPVGRQAGRGEEVRALHEDARRPLPVERDLDDRCDRLPVAGVVLTHGQEPAAAGVEADVRVPVVTLRRDRLGLRDSWVQAIQPPVGPIREDDRAAGHGVRPAAVLVDSRADVEWRRASGPRWCRPRRAGPGRSGRPRRAGPPASRSRRRRSTAPRDGPCRRAGHRCGSATASCRTAGATAGRPGRLDDGPAIDSGRASVIGGTRTAFTRRRPRSADGAAESLPAGGHRSVLLTGR